MRLGPGHGGEVPWMALLLFREDELPEDRDAVGTVAAGTVREFLDGGLGPGKTPRLSPESIRPEEYDEHCATVLVPAALFDALAPLPVEMGYLAHVRGAARPTPPLPGTTRNRTRRSSTRSSWPTGSPPPPVAGDVLHLVSSKGSTRI